VEGFNGLVTCDAQDAASTPWCAISMPVQGGIEGSLCEGKGVVVCGSGHDDTVWQTLDWYAMSPTGNGKLDTMIRVAFVNPVLLDTLGTFPATIEVTQQLPNDAGKLAWQTPPGACSITLAGSVCSPKSKTWRVSGTGSCSQSAAPETGTSEPITIGSFTFIGGG
jgi:hypothetical protein